MRGFLHRCDDYQPGALSGRVSLSAGSTRQTFDKEFTARTGNKLGRTQQSHARPKNARYFPPLTQPYRVNG